jgi:hypothetical protein
VDGEPGHENVPGILKDNRYRIEDEDAGSG